MTKTGTSLCSIVFNGGALIFSDLQASMGFSKVSDKQKKIWKLEENIILAGTGSVSGLQNVAEEAKMQFAYYKAKQDFEPIDTQTGLSIIKEIVPYEDACFLIGIYDQKRSKGYIAEIFDDGSSWQSDICQLHGSGSSYMLSKADSLSKKVLSTVDKEVLITEDIYQMISNLKFDQNSAMLEGLEIISAGVSCDVFSGGKGYQLMVVNASGIEQYVISRDLAELIVSKKLEAEFSATNPLIKRKRFNNYDNLFLQAKR